LDLPYVLPRKLVDGVAVQLLDGSEPA
jgi:hypothetical protein